MDCGFQGKPFLVPGPILGRLDSQEESDQTVLYPFIAGIGQLHNWWIESTQDFHK